MPGSWAGIRTSTRHSSSSIAVVKWPWKKSAAAITRSPRVLRTSTSPSSAATTQGISADASAWATVPPTVPRVRMAAWPMYGSASASSGSRSRTTADRSACRSRTVAPKVTVSAPPSMVVEPGHAVDVDHLGRLGEPHREQRDQALAAGQDLPLVTVLGEQCEHLVDGARRVIFEARHLHRVPPLS